MVDIANNMVTMTLSINYTFPAIRRAQAWKLTAVIGGSYKVSWLLNGFCYRIDDNCNKQAACYGGECSRCQFLLRPNCHFVLQVKANAVSGIDFIQSSVKGFRAVSSLVAVLVSWSMMAS
jgi:hypothetical protein